MDPKQVGSATFCIRHEHPDWGRNGQEYRFQPVEVQGVTISAVKHPDRALEIELKGALDRRTVFRSPIPPYDPQKGICVGLTWKDPEIKLYLQGKLVQTINSHIHITDMARELCLLPFGIRPEHVEETILKHDHLQSIKLMGDLELVFFCRRVQLSTRQFYMLVCCTAQEGSLRVDLAFKILPEVYGGQKDLTPLRLLEALVERFGLEIRVGKKKGKLILSEHIPLDGTSGTGIFGWDSLATPRQVIPTFHFRIVDGDDPYADCALCFAIDVTAYKRSIGK